MISANSYHACTPSQRVNAYNMAIIMAKGERVPLAHKRLHTPIDIWWVLHDGGLQLLLTTILRKSRLWAGCELRVFCVLQVRSRRIVRTISANCSYDLGGLSI